MDPNLILEAITAIEKGDAKAALELLKQLVASAAGADVSEASDAGDAGDPLASDSAVASEAASATLSVADFATLRSEMAGARADVRAVRAELAALTAERGVRELAERQELVSRLVVLGAETPSTAWLNADQRVPVARLASEPLADLRVRIAALSARPRVEERRPPVARLSARAAAKAATMTAAQQARYNELRALRAPKGTE